MGTVPQQGQTGSSHIWISQPRGVSNCYSDPQGRFAIVSTKDKPVHEFLIADPYTAALAFVDGTLSVRGDLFAAIRFFLSRPHSTAKDLFFSVLARLAHLRIPSILHLRNNAAPSIQFHYDRSNAFYSLFLDSRMVYSEADFAYPDQPLDEAQVRKLDRVCRSLELKPGDRFLDVGCGWGGLVTHAAEHYGVTALGCTLSKQQLEFARELVRSRGLSGRIQIELMDYRDLTGPFDKISSIGMFEHVGRSRLRAYFTKMYSLLRPGGLFLNRGLIRPQGVPRGPETLFLQQEVFPESEIVHLDEVVREGERAGFDATGLEDVRMNYAMTCRAWVRNLQDRAEECIALVSERTYRTWLLYLAGAGVSLEERKMSAAQVVFTKPVAVSGVA